MTVAPVPDASVADWKTSVNPTPVDTVPVLVTGALSVVATPKYASIGVTDPAVKSAPAGGDETVIAVHAEQLSPSLVSVMVPTYEALLSTHTRV